MTELTNRELNKAVAEATGWTELQQDDKGNWWGVPPGVVSPYTSPVPDWINDLPACMRDLWPWLKSQVDALTMRASSAGMKAKDEDWRERIQKLHMAHWPVSDYSTDPSGLVHWFVKELLGNWDIE